MNKYFNKNIKGKKEYEEIIAQTRQERMQWWHEARFGMFVHWGLYSLIGRHEWVQAIECIPKKEYEKLADKFKPQKNAAREWAKLAKDSGMKYMVFTAKHHEGFCLWNTEQTNYNSVQSPCGRDLVAEYVDACREFGLKTGFYYSLMDWHHPDGARAAYDPEARRRFLDFTKGCLYELMTKYGKVDILWYDVPRPLTHHEGWESLAMNQMIRELQPDIIINNRACLDEDFSTPEGVVMPEERSWEACMTFNNTSWGYMPSAAEDSHSPRDIIKMLNIACAGTGNLLLNISPAPDGAIPDDNLIPLKTVGKWLKENGQAVYGKLDRTPGRENGEYAQTPRASACGDFSQKGNKIYFWCRYWPGKELGLGGFKTKLDSARFLVSGQNIKFEQDGNRILFKDLPLESPDKIAGVTIIELTFEGIPQHKPWADTPELRI